MGIKLKKILRVNPQDVDQSKWYLTQANTGFVGIDEIAKEIAARSSLSLGDVKNVLSNLIECLPLFLKLGYTIRLTGFGSFHVTISSEGEENAEDLTTHHVKKIKLRFLPSSTIKRSLQEISFEIVES